MVRLNYRISNCMANMMTRCGTWWRCIRKKIKISQDQCVAPGPRQSIAENKLIVCRATGRPLIFPNVIEGVCALFENPGKKKGKIQTEGGGGGGSGKRMKKENEDERRRAGKKRKKTLTMQLWAHEVRADEWTTCVPGVFYWPVSVGWKFRIMYEMFAWTLLTLCPLVAAVASLS